MPKKYGILLLFILVKFLLQYQVIDPEYQLHRDEYLHLDQGQHLAWGYVSVPPFTSWISWIIFQLGNTEFWVKFFPALFGALTLIVVWKTIEELKGGIYALILGSTALVFSSLIRLNMLYQPNSFDILAWTSCFYLIIKYLNSENTKYLFYLGIAFALGFLNKYNIVFLFIGFVPALVLSPHRKIFTKKAFYLSAGLALMLILPNLIWQFQNDFPVLHHMKQLAEKQLINQDRMNFVKEQFLFFIGSFYVLLVGIVSLLVFPPFKKYRLFFWSLVFILSLFIYLKAKGYYAVGIYPVYLAFGAVYLEMALKNGWKKWLRPLLVIIPIIMFALIFRIVFPVYAPDDIDQILPKYQKYGLARWEDGKDHTLPQDFADMLGWKELASLVDSAAVLLSKGEQTLILCDNYGEAGAINFYSKNKNLKAVTFNADYINWFSLEKPIQNVILVQDPDDTDKERKREQPFFEKVIKIGEVKDLFSREKGAAVYLLLNAKVDVNTILKEEMKKGE